jgi:hypothetical protein
MSAVLGVQLSSWVSVVRVVSAGKLSSCREGAQRSGIQICLLAEDEGPKQGLSQKMCCLCSLQAYPHRLFSEGHGTQDGSLTCSGSQSPPGQTPLLWRGRCLDVWSLKRGLSQKLCCFSYFLFLKDLFSFSFTHEFFVCLCTNAPCLCSDWVG